MRKYRASQSLAIAAVLTASSVVALVAPARASAPELRNEDDRSYEYRVECSGSGSSTSIGAHTTRSLGLGASGCRLVVEGAGSADLADDVTCVIRGGSLSCS